VSGPDKDAASIGELYRKANGHPDMLGEGLRVLGHMMRDASSKEKREGVTPLRKISGKLSGSRNATPDSHADPSRDATCCHWCRVPFQSGEMRYPILDSAFDQSKSWSCPAVTVSICMPCFKDMNAEYHDPAAMQQKQRRAEEEMCQGCKLPPPKWRGGILPRRETQCPGCGEPIFVSPNLRPRLMFCSTRCYQRDYRKRRREKGGSVVDWKGRYIKCETCEKHYKPTRKDSKYCCAACKQWAYRMRHKSA
jgi:hypothetical protein